MNRIALLLIVLGLAKPLLTPPAHTVAVEDGRRLLKSPSGYQTVSMLDGGRTGLYYDSGELVGKLRPKAKDIVLLGLGGGEMLRAVRRTLPHARLVGVEIDPATARAAETAFGMKELGVEIVVADATKPWANRFVNGVDALLVDLYADSTMLPLTPAFFDAFWVVLRPGGLLLVNVYPASLYSSVAYTAGGAGFSVQRKDDWAPNVMLVGQKPY